MVHQLNRDLYNQNFDRNIVQVVEKNQRYIKNKFSDESTKESMMKAKNNLIKHLEDIRNREMKYVNRQQCLREYLHSFYLFLEAFRETNPHKKATLNFNCLQGIHINNEYDLQHILYSVLKPLCNDTRLEVCEDTGYGTVRADIKIPSLNTIIETKCTRQNMSYKKLIEEIEADIVHYKAEVIYFYIYDNEKIIKDKQNFEITFNKEFDGKRIEVIVLQPINM